MSDVRLDQQIDFNDLMIDTLKIPKKVEALESKFSPCFCATATWMSVEKFHCVLQCIYVCEFLCTLICIGPRSLGAKYATTRCV